jgi:uncharacterized protein YndB with AHSA1/START domain
MIGDLDKTGEGWQLRFSRELPHSADKVWAAITEPEQLANWFPDTIVVDEWKVGARLKFEHPDLSFDGEVRVVEPPSLLEFTWGPDTLRFEIVPHGDGCTLTLTDKLDELGKAARDGAGWHTCLDQLEVALGSGEQDWKGSDRWREVHPEYVEKFGPEAATLGPPEGALD